MIYPSHNRPELHKNMTISEILSRDFFLNINLINLLDFMMIKLKEERKCAIIKFGRSAKLTIHAVSWTEGYCFLTLIFTSDQGLPVKQ
jgi:hypothetical protein